ncbi:MAG TPA: heme exporter protein CcmD [Beijerinckiaceae bacterium]|nr:heme exporter protein CcmD [Beijerinckiaceae bacterium]
MPYPHIVYICAAYIVTAVIVGTMIAAILLDRRALERELARLTRAAGSDEEEAGKS